jgi:hypothetical protein
MRVADAYMAFQLVKRLSTPFARWPAHTAGIIDADGNVVKKYSQLSALERDKFTPFDAAVLKIKRLISRVPGGASALGGLVAGSMLLRREDEELQDWEVDSFINEDAPTNSVGSGQVAGAGQGVDGEPGAFWKYKAIRKRKKR